MSDIMKNLKGILNQNPQMSEKMKEMFGSMMQSNKTDQQDSSSSNFDFSQIDMNTLLKIQQVMKAMNKEQSNPRSNLLRSLKPYLKPSRQQQVDQYNQLLNLEEVFKLLNQPPPKTQN